MEKEPEWVAAALDQLDRLPEPHAELKRSTIILIVDAQLAGKAISTLWGAPGMCAKSTWNDKWCKNALIQDVLAQVRTLARRHQDTRTLRALENAAKYLALASPEAVGKLIGLLKSSEEAMVLRAAVAILDRAGVETAQKSAVDVEHKVSGEVGKLLEQVYGADGAGEGGEPAGGE